MAKIIKDDWEFRIQKINGEMFYSAKYAVSSEGVEQSREMDIEFSPQEETKIRNFIMNVVRPKIEEKESGN